MTSPPENIKHLGTQLEEIVRKLFEGSQKFSNLPGDRSAFVETARSVSLTAIDLLNLVNKLADAADDAAQKSTCAKYHFEIRKDCVLQCAQDLEESILQLILSAKRRLDNAVNMMGDNFPMKLQVTSAKAADLYLAVRLLTEGSKGDGNAEHEEFMNLVSQFAVNVSKTNNAVVWRRKQEAIDSAKLLQNNVKSICELTERSHFDYDPTAIKVCFQEFLARVRLALARPGDMHRHTQLEQSRVNVAIEIAHMILVIEKIGFGNSVASLQQVSRRDISPNPGLSAPVPRDVDVPSKFNDSHADNIINFLSTSLSWFGKQWESENENTKSRCLNALVVILNNLSKPDTPPKTSSSGATHRVNTWARSQSPYEMRETENEHPPPRPARADLGPSIKVSTESTNKTDDKRRVEMGSRRQAPLLRKQTSTLAALNEDNKYSDRRKQAFTKQLSIITNLKENDTSVVENIEKVEVYASKCDTSSKPQRHTLAASAPLLSKNGPCKTASLVNLRPVNIRDGLKFFSQSVGELQELTDLVLDQGEKADKAKLFKSATGCIYHLQQILIITNQKRFESLVSSPNHVEQSVMWRCINGLTNYFQAEKFEIDDREQNWKKNSR